MSRLSGVGDLLYPSMFRSMRMGGVGEPPFTDTAERDEFRRQQRVNVARRSKWEELDRGEVVFAKRWVEHRPTGRRFKVSHGLLDSVYTPVSAFVLTEEGDVIALEELR
jgi:hypothetical protein